MVTGATGAAGQTRRGVIAHAEILAQLGRHDEALTVIRTSFGDATDPELGPDYRLARKLKKIALFTLVGDARAGIAEVFFTFSAVLKSEAAGDYYVLLYSRVARYLRPDHIDALLLTAGLLESLGQYNLAIAEYRDVPASGPRLSCCRTWPR